MSDLNKRSEALAKQFRVSDKVAAILSQIEAQAGVLIGHGQPSILVLKPGLVQLSAQNIRDGVLRVFCGSRYVEIPCDLEEVQGPLVLGTGTMGAALTSDAVLDDAVDFLLKGKNQEPSVARHFRWDEVGD